MPVNNLFQIHSNSSISVASESLAPGKCLSVLPQSTVANMEAATSGVSSGETSSNEHSVVGRYTCVYIEKTAKINFHFSFTMEVPIILTDTDTRTMTPTTVQVNIHRQWL